MDNLLSNKYFCIAIIIALIIVVYLYSQKKPCEIEGMRHVDLTPLAQELTEHPWTNRVDESNNKEYNNQFDEFADEYTNLKLTKNGYRPQNYLKRSDVAYEKYIENERYTPHVPNTYRFNRYRQHSDPIRSRRTSLGPRSAPLGPRSARLGPRSAPLGPRRPRQNLDEYDDIPKPLDRRPDLSQCQPCVCPQDSLISTEDDSDSEYQQRKPKYRRAQW